MKVQSTSRMRRLRRGAALLSPLLLSIVPAQAQSVDYRAMEELFGEPVTTSVTGKPQRVADAPANIEIITSDDIRRSGATSIPDVLRFVTGIDVRYGGISSPDVGIRGYNQTANPHLMVLVNGRQIYMVDYGRILWSSLPVQLEEIRQIEVIKGPNSALYGFNAVGGVINIVTYDPLKDRVNAATARFGTQDYGALSVVGTGRIGETAALRLSIGAFRSHDYVPAAAMSAEDRLTRQSPFAGAFNADGRWQITPQVTAFLEGSYGNARLSLPSFVGAFETEAMRHYSFRAGVAAETPYGVIELSGYRNKVDLTAGAITGVLPVETSYALHEQQSFTMLQVSDLVKLGPDHTVRLAVEYRENMFNAVDVGGLTDRIYAGSVMWDWQVTRNLTATSAIRLDHVNVGTNTVAFPYGAYLPLDFRPIEINATSLNAGLVWRATGADTFRASIARGIQLPTLLEQGLRVDIGRTGPAGFFGRPSLLPAATWSAELDYDRSLPSIASVLRTAVFAQRTDNVIATPAGGTLRLVPPGFPIFVAANVGYSTAAGAEIGLKGHSPSGWRWNASYALAETTDHTSNNAGMLLSPTYYSRSAPEHVVVLGLGYTQDRWEADAIMRWQSSFRDTRAPLPNAPLQPVTVDNYVVVNARVGFRVIEGLTVAVVGQQLNQQRLLTTGPIQMERRLIGVVSARF